MPAFGTGPFGVGPFGVGDGAVDPALIGTPSTGTAVETLAFISLDADPLDCPLASGNDATFEGTSSWQTGNAQTVLGFPAPPHAGTTSRRLTRTTSTGTAQGWWQSAVGSVTADRWHMTLIYISPEQTARTGQITITWQTAASATLSTVTSTAPQILGQWRPLLVVGLAPAGVSRMRVDVAINGCAVGETHLMDTFAADRLGTLLGPGRLRDVSWRRGRNDELGQVQASTATLKLVNADGYLTPDSTTAPVPYLGNIDSGRRVVVIRRVAGVYYPEWTGTTETWDQSIHSNGRWSEVQLQCTDASAWFGRPVLPPLPAEIMLDDPDSYFRLNEQKGALAAGSIAGDSSIATLATSKYGASGTTFGGDNAAPVVDTGRTADDGQGWLTLNPETVSSTQEPGSVLDFSNVPAANPGASPTGWTMEMWVRIPTTNPTETVVLFRSARYIGGSEEHSGFQVQMLNNGVIVVNSPTELLLSSGIPIVSSKPTTIPITLTWQPGGGTYGTLRFRWGYQETSTALPNNPYVFGVPDRVWIGGAFQSYVRSLQYAWRTPIAHVAFWRRAVPSYRLAAHASVGMDGGSFESEGNRIGGVANLVGWPEAWTRVDIGLSSLMGRSWQGTTALALIQDIAKQASALVIVDAAGKLVMRNRHARVNTPAVATFRAADGTAITARDFAPKKDDQFVENSIKVTRTTGATTVASDATSIRRYGEKPADDIEVAIDSDEEAAALGKFRVATRKDNKARVASLTLQPGARPALWPILLGLEDGDRVSVQGLPDLAPWQTLDALVESIESRQDGSPRNTVYTLGLSPWRADLHQMAQLDTGGNLSLLGAAECQAGWY